MCSTCGCGLNSVGSQLGQTPVLIQDVTSKENSGVTLSMTSTLEQGEGVINE